MPLHQDSTGRPIEVGSRVRFRGQEYTIKAFPGDHWPLRLEFEEELHTPEVPTEESVDLVTDPPASYDPERDPLR